MYYLKSILLFSLFLTLKVSAQVDTNYIQRFPNKLVLSPYISSQSSFVSIEPYDWAGDTTVTPFEYQPNLRGGYGLSFSYRVIDFSIGFRKKLSDQNEKLYGKSSSFGLSFRLWATRKVLTEFTFQSISGFANTSTQQFDTINYSENYPFQLRPDLTVQFLKMRMVYQFNPEKFSYRAAFGFSERQKKSSAGFLLNTQLYLHNTFADSSIIPSQLQKDYDGYGNIHSMATFALGIAPGVGGTWTKGKWFLTGVLFVGSDIQRFAYDVPGSTVTKKETKLAANADARISFGYNTPRFYFGFSSCADYNLLRPSPFKLNTSFTRGLFSVGYRFNSPKILDTVYDGAVNTIIPKKLRKFMY